MFLKHKTKQETSHIKNLLYNLRNYYQEQMNSKASRKQETIMIRVEISKRDKRKTREKNQRNGERAGSPKKISKVDKLLVTHTKKKQQ